MGRHQRHGRNIDQTSQLTAMKDLVAQPHFSGPLVGPLFIDSPGSNRTFFRHNIQCAQKLVQKGDFLYGTSNKKVRWRARGGGGPISRMFYVTPKAEKGSTG